MAPQKYLSLLHWHWWYRQFKMTLLSPFMSYTLMDQGVKPRFFLGPSSCLLGSAVASAPGWYSLPVWTSSNGFGRKKKSFESRCVFCYVHMVRGFVFSVKCVQTKKRVCFCEVFALRYIECTLCCKNMNITASCSNRNKLKFCLLTVLFVYF